MRLYSVAPVVTTLLTYPGAVVAGSLPSMYSAAWSMRLPGMVLFGKGVRLLGSGLERGS